ncbi:MAG: PAS domain S-box protein, partial [Deinococcota bacterium]
MAESNPSSHADNNLSQDALAERVKQLEAELAACQASSNTNLHASLASILKHNLTATAIFDTDMRYVAANDKWLQDYGLEQHNIIGKSHYEIFPDISDAWKDVHTRCLAGHSESKRHDPYLRDDGSLMWMDWSVYPWFKQEFKQGSKQGLDPTETPAGIVMSTDIVTAQVQAREEARVFHKLVEASSDGIVMSDLDNTITYANSAYKRMLALPVTQELVGTSITDHLADAGIDDNRLATINATTWQEGTWQGVLQQKRTSGEVFPAQVNSFAMRDAQGALTKRAAIYQDISGEQALLRTVSDNEQRLKMIITGLPIMLFATDPNGTITLSEGRELVHLGVRPGEVVGQSIFDYYRDMPVITDHVRRALAGEAVTFEAYYTKYDQHFERYFSPLKDADGTITGMMGIAFNITERKRAKTELEAWKNRYDLVVASTGQAVFEYDIASGNIKWGQSVENILGHSLDTMNDGGIELWKTLLHPDDTATEVAELEHVTANAENYCSEYRLQHAAGHYIDVLESGVSISDEQGNTVTMVGILQDISNRKVTEDTLRLSETRLQALLSNLPIIVFSTDSDGIFTSSEGKGLEALGLEAGQVVGMSLFDVYAGNDVIIKHVKEALQGTTLSHESEAAGQHFETYYIPFTEADGTVSGLLGVSYNTTLRKQSEQALEAERSRLLALYKAIPDRIMRFDHQGTYLEYKPASYFDSEMSPENVIGKTLDEVAPPEVAKQAYASLQSVFKTNEMQTFENVLVSNGETHYRENRIVKLNDDEALVFIRDITDLKRAEAALRENQQFLEDAQSMGKLGGWSFDLVTQELYWSKQVYDISEVPYDTELTVELAVSVYVDPIAIEDAMANTIKTHKPYDVELEIITLKGNRRWVRSIGKPVVEDGKVVKLVGTHQDITDMKQVQAQLLESQQFLEDAQSIGKLGGWSFDVATQEIAWSKQVYDTMEAPYDSELTTPFLMSFYADATTLQNAMAAAMGNSEAYDLELEITTLKGNHRWVRAIGRPVLDNGKVVKLVGTQQDITDIKQVEAQLLESQQFLEDAQSMGKLGGWSFNLLTQDLYWSKQVYDISEASYDTELTVELAVSVYVDPTAIEAAMANTIETHEPYDVELEIITLKGNHRWVRSIGKPIVEDGKVVKLVGTHQDITDMKQAELGLQVANDNLARLNKLSEQLNGVETIDEMLYAILEPLPADTIASILYPVYDDNHALAAFELAASHLPSGTSTVQPGTRYPLGAFPSMDIWLDSPDSMLIVEDIANNTTLDSSVSEMHLQLGFASLVFIALTQADDVISIVGFYWRDKHVFSDGERAYLSALSSLLTPITVNRQLLANLEKTVTTRTQELQTQLTETLRFRALFESSPDIVGY